MSADPTLVIMSRPVLVFVTLFLGAQAQHSSTEASTVADITDTFDQVVDKLREGMRQKGLDPMDIPDTNLTIPIPTLLTRSSSIVLGLKNGRLENLSQLQRNGNVTLEAKKGALEISIPLIFKTLKVYYTAIAQVFHIGPEARLLATVEDLKVFLVIDVNIFKKGVNVSELELTEARKIHVRVSGLFLLDPFADIISTVFVNFFKTVVLKVAEIKVREEANKVTSSIDIFQFL